MDREDWLYLLGAALVALGAGLFHPGYGLACAGLALVFPALLSMLCSSPKDKP